jgi:hypothetical protein
MRSWLSLLSLFAGLVEWLIATLFSSLLPFPICPGAARGWVFELQRWERGDDACFDCCCASAFEAFVMADFIEEIGLIASNATEKVVLRRAVRGSYIISPSSRGLAFERFVRVLILSKSQRRLPEGAWEIKMTT